MFWPIICTLEVFSKCQLGSFLFDPFQLFSQFSQLYYYVHYINIKHSKKTFCVRNAERDWIQKFVHTCQTFPYERLQAHVNALCNKRVSGVVNWTVPTTTYLVHLGAGSIARIKKQQTCCTFEKSLEHIAMVDSSSKWASQRRYNRNTTLQTCQTPVQSQWAR